MLDGAFQHLRLDDGEYGQQERSSHGLLDALRRYIRCVRSHRGPVQDRCVRAFSLGERAAAEGKVPPIPEHIITKPPSAELSPDAEDEKALGIDYATLDQILIAHFEQGKPAEEIVAAGFDPEEVAYAIRRTNSYAFKRAVEPPFPEAKFYD